MVKRVFSGDMVFHAWASQNVDYGRRSDDRVQFKGRSIYSYGNHYMLGHIMPNNVVLLNNYKHSVSTGAHMSSTRAATRHMTQYFLPDLQQLINSGYGTFESEDYPASHDRAIMNYISKYWQKLADDTGEYLISIMHERNTTFAKWKAKAVKAEQDKAAKQEREHIRFTLDKARRYARAPLAVFMSDVAAQAGRSESHYVDRKDGRGRRWDKCTPSENLDGYRSEIRNLLAVARRFPQRISKDVVKELESRARYIREFGKRKDAVAIQFVRLTQWRDAKLRFRSAIARFERPDWTYADERNVLELLRWFVDNCPDYGMIHGGKIQQTQKWIETRGAERHARERLEQEEATRRREEIRLEREAKRADDIKAWLAGDTSVSLPRFSDEQGRACLRVVGDQLETSWGAFVPLEHAIKVFRMVKLCRENKRDWSKNGATIRVGHFQVDHIYQNGNFQAGCHEIGWNEVERVAKLIGVFDMPAENTTETREHA